MSQNGWRVFFIRRKRRFFFFFSKLPVAVVYTRFGHASFWHWAVISLVDEKKSCFRSRRRRRGWPTRLYGARAPGWRLGAAARLHLGLLAGPVFSCTKETTRGRICISFQSYQTSCSWPPFIATPSFRCCCCLTPFSLLPNVISLASEWEHSKLRPFHKALFKKKKKIISDLNRGKQNIKNSVATRCHLYLRRPFILPTTHRTTAAPPIRVYILLHPWSYRVNRSAALMKDGRFLF